MSENEERAPLTRRERRLRELAETGALNLSELSADELAAQQGVAEADGAVPAEAQDDADDIEISPLNPDGTPRSRREIRMLREQALAARAAAREAAETEPEVTEPEAVEPEVVVPEDAVAEEPAVAEPEVAEPAVVEAEVAEPEVTEPEGDDLADDEPEAAEPAVEEPAQDFDSLISPPTEPFTVEELREAESVTTEEPEEAESSEPAPEPKAKRKFWKLGKDSAAKQALAEPEAAPEPERVPEPEAEITVETEIAAAEPEDAAAEPATVVEELVAEEPAVDEPVATEPVEAEDEPAVEDEPEAEAAPATEEGPATEAPVQEQTAANSTKQAEDAKETKESYSFPDIAPPEEWRSVFDDPATRNVPSSSNEPQGDFDDLISRAVAQEGSTNGTSALILPAMPEDTGGLAGPLGATGELYVTGSMRLPKSLGETGGHVPLHESAEIDPITGAVTEDEHGTVAGPAPVSARHAVSARVVSGVPAVAKPAREKSKLPLVLGLTGGGLLVVVIGVGVWGAMNGFFG